MGMFLLGLIVVALGVGLVWLLLQHRALRARYLPIIDVDREVAARKREIERIDVDLAARNAAAASEQLAAESRHAERLAAITHSHEAAAAQVVAKRAELDAQYQRAFSTYERLRAELALLQEQAEQVEVGLYRPSFAFDTPEKYKDSLEAVWQRQKEMVKDGRATACPNSWVVGGSAADGKRMQVQLAKLMLRAFNGEVEAAVAKVTWSNVTKMEERIRKARESINALGTVIGVSVTSEYADLALQELRLTYELERKKRDVAEEQREIRERLKEEERAVREAARAEEEAAKEETRYERALAKARGDAEEATGAALAKLQAKIEMLEGSLQEAHAQRARAKSMAEQTKSGYVYVISNVGSFGEGVFKIGMTRRLDPMDRVKELGDASVPFEFDVHAMCYAADAPKLESELHQQFSAHRVNLVNHRKEFFAVSIDEIASYAARRGLALELTKLAEAREFRETKAMRARTSSSAGANTGDAPRRAQESFSASLASGTA